MPELPEVEHAARSLRAWMQGRRVVRAVAAPTRIIGGEPPARFASALKGRRLEEVGRRGKHLLLKFDGDVGVLAHLGMTGKLVHRPLGHAELYSHARFELEDRTAVHFRDPRKFGRLRLLRGTELESVPEIAQLGPDAADQLPDAAGLGGLLGRTRRPVKVALMDQAVLAGLGNIHAAEALFRAGIDPRRRADKVNREQLARLVAAIRETIGYALARMPRVPGPAVRPGQRPPEQEDIEYVEEGGENPFLVYDRKGEPCPRCGAKLRALVQGGRTTYYCARCQR